MLEATVTIDARSAPRDEVRHHARGFEPDGRPLHLLVVNVSPGGLMARCDEERAPGDRLRVHLPGLGLMGAEVRWSLGGRIGCRFDAAVPLARYYELLAAMRA